MPSSQNKKYLIKSRRVTSNIKSISAQSKRLWKPKSATPNLLLLLNLRDHLLSSISINLSGQDTRYSFGWGKICRRVHTRITNFGYGLLNGSTSKSGFLLRSSLLCRCWTNLKEKFLIELKRSSSCTKMAHNDKISYSLSKSIFLQKSFFPCYYFLLKTFTWRILPQNQIYHLNKNLLDENHSFWHDLVKKISNNLFLSKWQGFATELILLDVKTTLID